MAVVLMVLSTATAAQQKPRPATPPAPGEDQLVVAYTVDSGAEYRNVSFVADKALPIYEAMDTKSKVIRPLAPLEIAAILEIQPGWAKVAGGLKNPRPGQRNTRFEGWVEGGPATATYLIAKDMTDTGSLLGTLGEKTWSIADKHAILRGVPRVGFSVEQLDLAMGEPASSLTEETPAGVIEVRSYGKTTVTISKSKVTRVLTAK
jgi:hypothetical protein